MFERLKALISPSKPPLTENQISYRYASRSDFAEEDDSLVDATHVQALLANLSFDKKRKLEESPELTPSKRRRSGRGYHTPYSENGVDPSPKSVKYRKNEDTVQRLPIPATLNNGARIRQAVRKSMNKSEGFDLDTDSQLESSAENTVPPQHHVEQYDEYSTEQARRHVAAVSLPPNSGLWEKSEKELFYHLALRGFEPLLPRNWMLDFKTLPLSLFIREDTDDQPLICNVNGSEFRAIRALRDLIETGKLIRDKSLTSPGFHAENVLEKALSNYLSWAFWDISVNSASQTLPVHAIVSRRKGQTTAGAIAELTSRLHYLAAQHRDLQGIQPSIESSYSTPYAVDQRQTQVLDEVSGLPVLTGLLLASSVLVVFTLNAHSSSLAALSPRYKQQEGLCTPISESLNSQANPTGSEESGLRFIATFDFSQPAQDVWSALSAAIVVMHVRKTMLSYLQDDVNSKTISNTVEDKIAVDDHEDPDL